MRPLPPPTPWQRKPGESHIAPDEYTDQPTLRLPVSLAHRAETVADIDTQPLPSADAPPRLLAPASSQQTDFRDRQAQASLLIEEKDTLRLPSVGAPPHPKLARQPEHTRRPHHTARRGRAHTRRSRFQAPPWLARVVLLLGLIVLGVRAAYASSTFMEPGGYILGWSRLPVAHCVVCHLPQPTATSTSTRTQPLTPDQYAALLVPQLTLDEKLAQMMLVQFAGLQPTPDAVEMMNVQGAGGVLFFTSNISSRSQVRSLTSQLQQMSSIPPLLVVDQEGGTVNRLINIVGPLPPASSLKTTQAAKARGTQDAGLLAELGFNLDLAPVIDVGTANPQLYERTFGSNPDQVATLAGAYLEGLQQSGKVVGTLKHFPGLGDTTTDPHIGLPVLTRSRADWERIDLEPYRVLLKSENVQAIMVTHELVRAVDTQFPASLSPALINGVLRGELGFDGVVITDSLYMGALNQRWSVAQAAVLAIKAGADIVIGPSDPQMVQQTIDAFKQALANGTLKQATIDTAVRRILALKIRMGLIPLPQQ
jgi:beta-N-acetylhexosaminidase